MIEKSIKISGITSNINNIFEDLLFILKKEKFILEHFNILLIQQNMAMIGFNLPFIKTAYFWEWNKKFFFGNGIKIFLES